MKQQVLRPLTHYVHRPYIFLGVADHISEPEKAKEVARSQGCDLSAYINPSASIVLAKHESHLESMLLLVSHLNKICDFKETYFGCEAKIRDHDEIEPSPVNLMFVALPQEPDLYKRHWEALFWKVFRVFDDKWVFFYSNDRTVLSNPLFAVISEQSTDQINGLSCILRYNQERVQKTKRIYDPLEATSAELKYQLLHAHSYSQDEYARLREKLGLVEDESGCELVSLDYRTQFILRMLQIETEKTGQALKALGSGLENIQHFLALLNEFERVAGVLKSTRFISRTDEKTYKLLESEEILNVEDGFMLEACDSIGLKGPHPIVIPGRGYYFRVNEAMDETIVVEMPTIVGPRLGLLPMLYRLVPQLFIERTRGSLSSVLDSLGNEIQDYLKTQTSKRLGLLGGKPLRSLTELAADLIAARIGGPAYLYALLRGLPCEVQLKEGRSVAFEDRVCILGSFFKDRDIVLRFAPKKRKKIELTRDPSLKRLVGLVEDLDLASEYSRETHESDMPDAKLGLIMGEVRPIEPSIVANALWDTVFDTKKYLNENAAFLSVLEWTKSTETYRKTWDMSSHEKTITRQASEAEPVRQVK
jgi:hypothetical protein